MKYDKNRLFEVFNHVNKTNINEASVDSKGQLQDFDPVGKLAFDYDNDKGVWYPKGYEDKGYGIRMTGIPADTLRIVKYDSADGEWDFIGSGEPDTDEGWKKIQQELKKYLP
jgi:hypothetical protein